MSRGVSAESTREGPPTIFPVPNERHAETGGVPVPRTSFVGREREVGLVQALLRRDDVRLVTLTGPGGVGKTRTAIRAASSAPHSARFVDLADVQQPALVLPTIAAALGVRPDGRPVLDYLRAVLRHGDHLLVLDNFEQVLPAASTLADLLDACPNVTLLATSRAVLGVPGEHVVDVRPFPLPPPESDADAVGFDACRLFVDRARTLDPEFALTSANAGTVVGICRRLDGLPLAIELAASWVPVLSPGALLSQLERRLALPGGVFPGLPRGTGACGTRSRGATDCSALRRRPCSGASRSSTAAARSMPSRRCAGMARWTCCRSCGRWSRTVWSGVPTTPPVTRGTPCSRRSASSAASAWR
jgi:hypothetical protein